MNIRLLNSRINFSKLSDISGFKMSLIVVLMVMSGFLNSVKAADYILDNTSSKVKWEAKKVTGKHNGSITFVGGTIAVAKNIITGGSFVMDMKTILDEDLTNEGMKNKLMGHLASDDFFSVAKFPESKMEIKKVTPVAGDEYKFLADLTIKGITNPVEFNATVKVSGNQLNAEGVITVNRTLYGIKYGSGKFFEGLGDKMIYDEFTLAFNVIAQKK